MRKAIQSKRSARQAVLVASLMAPIAGASCYLFNPDVYAAIFVTAIAWISVFARDRPWRDQPPNEEPRDD